MTNFRYVAEMIDYDDFQYLIGKFDDENSNSIKFFIAENGFTMKYAHFDDCLICSERKKINIDLIKSLNFESDDESEIKEVVTSLVIATN